MKMNRVAALLTLSEFTALCSTLDAAYGAVPVKVMNGGVEWESVALRPVRFEVVSIHRLKFRNKPVIEVEVILDRATVAASKKHAVSRAVIRVSEAA